MAYIDRLIRYTRKGFFWMLLCGVSYMAFTPRVSREIISFNDKIIHILAFFALSGAAEWGRISSRWHIIISLVVYGALVEIIQSQIPGRNCSSLDFGADLIGISMYYCFHFIMNRYCSYL